MATRAERKVKNQELYGERVTVTKTEMAHHLNCDPEVIESSIESHLFPPPKFRPSERKSLWLRSHWQQYLRTGVWPKEAYPSSRSV